MKVSGMHIIHQGPVIATLARTALSGVLPARLSKAGEPGQVYRATVSPRPRKLVDDFIRHVGGDPAAYAGTLPPTLFPQWGFPLMAKTLSGQPYNLRNILNGGCRIEINSALPSDEPLKLTAELEEVDDNGYRVIFRQKLITETEGNPNALVSYVNGILPLKKSPGGKDNKKPAPPKNAKEIDRWKVAGNAGLEFALLTGDFNPVHWVRPYAKMAGFSSTILHGFSTMARAIEALNREVFDGRPDRLQNFEARFVSPFSIPGTAGVYLSSKNIFVAPGPGQTAYLSGSYDQRTGE